MKPEICFRMKSETTNMTMNMQQWIWFFFDIVFLWFVRGTFRYCFEWKVKPQISQSTYTKMDLENFYYRIFFTFSDAPLDILSNEKWYYNNHKENVKMVSGFFFNLGILWFCQMTLYIFFWIECETTYITINSKNWCNIFFHLGI